jgi:hypothetical protein
MAPFSQISFRFRPSFIIHISGGAGYGYPGYLPPGEYAPSRCQILSSVCVPFIYVEDTACACVCWIHHTQEEERRTDIKYWCIVEQVIRTISIQSSLLISLMYQLLLCVPSRSIRARGPIITGRHTMDHAEYKDLQLGHTWHVKNFVDLFTCKDEMINDGINSTRVNFSGRPGSISTSLLHSFPNI